MAATVKRHVEKGLESKQNIYNVSKKVFREYGYNSAKIKMIVERADVPLGLFSYYFKTKERLLNSIYADYNTAIRSCLKHNEWFANDTSLFQHMCITQIYYSNIFADEACKRFYLEVLERDLNTVFSFDAIYARYMKFYDDYKISVDKKDLKSIILFDFGARRQFLVEYKHGNIDMDENDMIKHIASITPLLLRIDYSEIERIFNKIDKYIVTTRCDSIMII